MKIKFVFFLFKKKKQDGRWVGVVGWGGSVEQLSLDMPKNGQMGVEWEKSRNHTQVIPHIPADSQGKDTLVKWTQQEVGSVFHSERRADSVSSHGSGLE